MVETCIFEAEHNPLVAWSNETIRKGGIVVPDVVSGLRALYSHFHCDNGPKLRSYTQTSDFYIYGAWVEKCLLEWTELMIGVFDAHAITIDLTKSFSKIETQQYNKPQILTPSERLAMLSTYSTTIVNSPKVKLIT